MTVPLQFSIQGILRIANDVVYLDAGAGVLPVVQHWSQLRQCLLQAGWPETLELSGERAFLTVTCPNIVTDAGNK